MQSTDDNIIENKIIVTRNAVFGNIFQENKNTILLFQVILND